MMNHTQAQEFRQMNVSKVPNQHNPVDLQTQNFNVFFGQISIEVWDGASAAGAQGAAGICHVEVTLSKMETTLLQQRNTKSRTKADSLSYKSNRSELYLETIQWISSTSARRLALMRFQRSNFNRNNLLLAIAKNSFKHTLLMRFQTLEFQWKFFSYQNCTSCGFDMDGSGPSRTDSEAQILRSRVNNEKPPSYY